MTSPCPSIHIHVSCHCRQFTYDTSLLLTQFPLKSALCHCSSCRHATGHLFATFAVLPLPLPNDASGFDRLTRYDSSPGFSRYFCSTCGASVLNVEPDEWEFATGVLEFSTQGGHAFDLVEGGLLDRGLLFIGDTFDGGAASWINQGKAEGLACRNMGHRGSQTVTDAMLVGMSRYSNQISPSRGTKLRGNCHCGDVEVEILPPDGDDRYGASLCACTSCSKTCGFEITSWVRTPLEKVKIAEGSLQKDQMKLMSYSSSPNVERHFCKRCGATISYAKKDGGFVDIGVGLLNAPEGSRAEQWCEWNKDGDNVSYHEDAVDQKFVQALVEGVKKVTK